MQRHRVDDLLAVVAETPIDSLVRTRCSTAANVLTAVEDH